MVVKNIGVYDVGTIFCTEIFNVKNNHLTDSVMNVQVHITVPPGVVFSSANLPQGSYDSVNKIWNVGPLAPQQFVTGTICWEITDASYDQYKFDFMVSSASECEGCIQSQKSCVIVTGISCQTVASCLECYATYEPTRTTAIDTLLVPGVDQVLRIDNTGGPVEVTLPASADMATEGTCARYFVLIALGDPDANPITVTCDGAETLRWPPAMSAVTTTALFEFQYEAITLRPDKISAWDVM